MKLRGRWHFKAYLQEQKLTSQMKCNPAYIYSDVQVQLRRCVQTTSFFHSLNGRGFDRKLAGFLWPKAEPLEEQRELKCVWRHPEGSNLGGTRSLSP
jgi:hypothetical protein